MEREVKADIKTLIQRGVALDFALLATMCVLLLSGFHDLVDGLLFFVFIPLNVILAVPSFLHVVQRARRRNPFD